MATDMYSAAFPQITADLATNSTMLGFTLTTFFIGYASGQVLGGAISDQIGRAALSSRAASSPWSAP